MDLEIGPTDDELGLTLRMRKDGHICILSIDPYLCPVLHEAAAAGVLVPGHPIATIDRVKYDDISKAAAYIRARVKEHPVLITLERREITSSRGLWSCVESSPSTRAEEASEREYVPSVDARRW